MLAVVCGVWYHVIVSDTGTEKQSGVTTYSGSLGKRSACGCPCTCKDPMGPNRNQGSRLRAESESDGFSDGWVNHVRSLGVINGVEHFEVQPIGNKDKPFETAADRIKEFKRIREEHYKSRARGWGIRDVPCRSNRD